VMAALLIPTFLLLKKGKASAGAAAH